MGFIYFLAHVKLFISPGTVDDEGMSSCRKQFSMLFSVSTPTGKTKMPLCSLLPSAFVVLGCRLNGYLNTEPHRGFQGALGILSKLVVSIPLKHIV